MFRTKKIDLIILLTASNNQYEITKEALDSIHSDKYNIETYILNYGENDSKIRSLKSRVTEYKEFPANTPITKEMNWGIRKALDRTNLIMNINNDIVFSPDTLDAMIKIMKTTDIKSLCGHIITEKEDVNNYRLDKNLNLYYKDNFISHNKYKNWLEILYEDFGFDLYSCNIWHKDYLKIVGLPDEKLFNQGIYFWDTDMQYRGVLHGLDTYVASSAIYYHACAETANTSVEARKRLDDLYIKMKLVYRDKWGGNLKNSKYIGTQHNESYAFEYMNKKSSKQILREIEIRNKKIK